MGYDGDRGETFSLFDVWTVSSLPPRNLFTSRFPENGLKLNDWVSVGFKLLSVTGFRLHYALETSITIRPSGGANLMGSPGRH